MRRAALLAALLCELVLVEPNGRRSAALCDGAISELRSVMASGSEWLDRVHAAEALILANSTAGTRSFLKSATNIPDVRIDAWRALAMLQSKGWTGKIRASYLDQDQPDRRIAARALGQMHALMSAQQMVQVQEEVSSTVDIELKAYLLWLQHDQGVPTAEDGLGVDQGVPTAEDGLVALLQHDKAEVVQAAAFVLRHLPEVKHSTITALQNLIRELSQVPATAWLRRRWMQRRRAAPAVGRGAEWTAAQVYVSSAAYVHAGGRVRRSRLIRYVQAGALSGITANARIEAMAALSDPRPKFPNKKDEMARFVKALRKATETEHQDIKVAANRHIAGLACLEGLDPEIVARSEEEKMGFWSSDAQGAWFPHTTPSYRPSGMWHDGVGSLLVVLTIVVVVISLVRRNMQSSEYTLVQSAASVPL